MQLTHSGGRVFVFGCEGEGEREGEREKEGEKEGEKEKEGEGERKGERKGEGVKGKWACLGCLELEAQKEDWKEVCEG
ncbi:uncharacterized protein MONOS_10313 [Monocercomonoides exilis]|uniref:uncharacterized protein n=1 Tax=Monocercomonoides exilis TaxID=2049356 RepID=UPI0035599FC8|nr:hypothetical protein MONOS_10313 [Monocercomonoides exilis]|eukprot:MONOS_10313.1-p1 / transcript=MONOS_10313.1 / gene=MONOS_10313 / organism=Monocercomonoides_exilis_PA203 / gene_product=unspecified product / transcript_product=unspecified product / location=Mono_scaffold00464:3145-3378(+) / protein_length=78 / sequence_SO=supercontig / SO=protein_coding / is_pseudo=false